MAPVRTSQRSLESWRRNAACNGTHTDLFFPVGEVGEEPVRQAEEAKVVCFACPVREECLEYALGHRSAVRHLGRYHRSRAPRHQAPPPPSPRRFLSVEPPIGRSAG